MFYLTGLVLYAFYQTHGDPLAAGRITKPDQILPYFVINELPAGLPGLLIAAIYCGHHVRHFFGHQCPDHRHACGLPPAALAQAVLGSRNSSGSPAISRSAYGALVILLAFGVGKLGALIEASNKAIGLVGGPLLGLFLLGMLVKRATPWGAVIGWAAGVAAVIPVCFCEPDFILVVRRRRLRRHRLHRLAGQSAALAAAPVAGSGGRLAGPAARIDAVARGEDGGQSFRYQNEWTTLPAESICQSFLKGTRSTCHRNRDAR